MKEDTDVCGASVLTTVLHGLPSPVWKSHFLLGFASLSISLVINSWTQRVVLWQLLGSWQGLAQSPERVLVPPAPCDRPA